MPLVKIYLRKGKSPEYLRSVSDAVHQALVATANVPPDDRFQIIQQLDPDRLIAHPSYGGVNRSEGLIIVEITLNVGRTVEIKKSLYAAIASAVGAALSFIGLIHAPQVAWAANPKATVAASTAPSFSHGRSFTISVNRISP